MKKSLLIFATVFITFSLMAVGYMNRSQKADNEVRCMKPNLVELYTPIVKPNLFYGVNNRYNNTIQIERMHNATSIEDLIPNHSDQIVHSYQFVKVSVLGPNHEESIVGFNRALSQEQLDLLQRADYSNQLRISSDYSVENTSTGGLYSDEFTYYMSIIPEVEANCSGGHEAFVAFLKENSEVEANKMTEAQVRPGKIDFTVTKTGTIDHVKLNSTGGSEELDSKLMKLISAFHGNWTPATDSNGNTVDQDLVFSYGKAGC